MSLWVSDATDVANVKANGLVLTVFMVFLFFVLVFFFFFFFFFLFLSRS